MACYLCYLKSTQLFVLPGKGHDTPTDLSTMFCSYIVRNVKDMVICRGSAQALAPCCSQLQRPSCSLQQSHDYTYTAHKVLGSSPAVCSPLLTQQACDCTRSAQPFTACLSQPLSLHQCLPHVAPYHTATGIILTHVRECIANEDIKAFDQVVTSWWWHLRTSTITCLIDVLIQCEESIYNNRDSAAVVELSACHWQ